MAAAGQFEKNPLLAVGVSGGADSMALVLSAYVWAAARSGRVVALTVDHGLRPEAAKEAKAVGKWLDAHGIEHHVLQWRPNPMPTSGLQDKARTVRRGMMLDWCRREGVLHLLLGHHRRDQAETVVMRRDRADAGPGLAGMPLVSEARDARIVRPFIEIDPDALRYSLEKTGQPWIEDPSNRDRRYERVRVRAGLPHDLTAVIADAALAADIRTEKERELTAIFAAHAICHPGGPIAFPLKSLLMLEADVLASLIGHAIRTVAGLEYLPRRRSLSGLAERILAKGFKSATLGGCRLKIKQGRLYVFRELSCIAPPLPLSTGVWVLWDRRIRFSLCATAASGDYRIDVFGREGDRARKARQQLDFIDDWPAEARYSMPALFRNDTMVWPLCLTDSGMERHPEHEVRFEALPGVPEPLINARFFVASGRR